MPVFDRAMKCSASLPMEEGPEFCHDDIVPSYTDKGFNIYRYSRIQQIKLFIRKTALHFESGPFQADRDRQ